jgi:CRISPR system Cascade subunit CasA
MQDYDLPDVESKEIAALLIEAPGGKTVRDNLAHFVKGGTVKGMTPHWAALALFTLQINAPAGGVGNRVSLRGGGPMTTLILPPEGESNTLWHQLWLNILTQEQMESLADGSLPDDPATIFPWLAPTRTSDKNGIETHPGDGHCCQMYWSMPRRIRLLFDSVQVGRCDLSGESCSRLVTGYITKNYGINYAGDWRHPLPPYSVDPKKGALPIKAQPGGIGYRHWLGLIVADEKNQKQPAKVIQVYQNNTRRRVIGGDVQPRVWAFGYDMDTCLTG